MTKNYVYCLQKLYPFSFLYKVDDKHFQIPCRTEIASNKNLQNKIITFTLFKNIIIFKCIRNFDNSTLIGYDCFNNFIFYISMHWLIWYAYVKVLVLHMFCFILFHNNIISYPQTPQPHRKKSMRENYIWILWMVANLKCIQL